MLYVNVSEETQTTYNPAGELECSGKTFVEVGTSDPLRAKIGFYRFREIGDSVLSVGKVLVNVEGKEREPVNPSWEDVPGKVKNILEERGYSLDE